jgi:hypothetical protein
MEPQMNTDISKPEAMGRTIQTRLSAVSVCVAPDRSKNKGNAYRKRLLINADPKQQRDNDSSQQHRRSDGPRGGRVGRQQLGGAMARFNDEG